MLQVYGEAGFIGRHLGKGITLTLGLVYLGANDALLDQQFKTIAQLNQSLPIKLRGASSEGLDLTDPGQPELKLRPAPNPSTQEKVSDR